MAPIPHCGLPHCHSKRRLNVKAELEALRARLSSAKEEGGYEAQARYRREVEESVLAERQAAREREEELRENYENQLKVK